MKWTDLHDDYPLPDFQTEDPLELPEGHRIALIVLVLALTVIVNVLFGHMTQDADVRSTEFTVNAALAILFLGLLFYPTTTRQAK